MIVYAKIKKLKKVGEIYREEVKETRYYLVEKVLDTTNEVRIEYIKSVDDRVEAKKTTDVISKKDLVNITVIGD